MTGQISFPSVFYFRYFCLFVFIILLPTQYFFAQKASNCPALSVSRPLWSNSHDDLIFESQLAREWWWSHPTFWGGDIWWSFGLERPSRKHVFFPHWIVYIYIYTCFWAGKFGSLNGCLENEMPWFCRCSKWQMHCLPTINKLLSTSPLASIYSYEIQPNPYKSSLYIFSPPSPKKSTTSPGGTTLADAWWNFTLAESTSGFLGGWGATWSFTSPTRRLRKKRVRVQLSHEKRWFRRNGWIMKW